MPPSDTPRDEEFWKHVRRARQMTSEERIREGFRLAEVERQEVLERFRSAHPDRDEQQLQAMVRTHFAELRRRERATWPPNLLP
jgi:hypothetical protein